LVPVGGNAILGQKGRSQAHQLLHKKHYKSWSYRFQTWWQCRTHKLTQIWN